MATASAVSLIKRSNSKQDWVETHRQIEAKLILISGRPLLVSSLLPVTWRPAKLDLGRARLATANVLTNDSHHTWRTQIGPRTGK